MTPAQRHSSYYWHVFADYTDDDLDERIAYWERYLTRAEEDFLGILESLYVERERRVDEKLLAWVEQK